MASFLNAADQAEARIRTYNDNVSAISKMHERILNDVDNAQLQTQLDDLTRDTRQLAQTVREQITELRSLGGNTRHGIIREKRAELLKERFQEALQGYHRAEQRFRAAQRTQAERQIRIVKPSATDQEVQAILSDTPDGQNVFQQALMNNDQYRKVQDAYHAVQARNNDIQRITQTMVELSQLMNDLALAVEKDEDKIRVIEQNAVKIEKDTEVGLQHSNKAKRLAESIRRNKIRCFLIFLVVVIIIAAVVGGTIAARNANR
ncbi:Plasma membrane t-SNARE, secretory vesicle fusion [Serendipita sp. 399]|nr:Plasma membrane t-SNARE, secretory vesicle fusion [Serendipita sp. 399]